MILDIVQDTSQKNWWNQELDQKSIFFYLLTWKSKDLMKFGFKTSPDNLKSDFCRPHHSQPSTSHIWHLQINLNELFPERRSHQRILRWYFSDYVRWFESRIHRTLKLSDNFQTLKAHKEFYTPICLNDALNTINAELQAFESSVKIWQQKRLY